MFMYAHGIMFADDDLCLGMNNRAFLRFLQVDEDILNCILSNEVFTFYLLLLSQGLLTFSNSFSIQLSAHLLQITGVWPSRLLAFGWRVGDELGVSDRKGRTVSEPDGLCQTSS
jgi:hypothetical protein